jgi:hypothetical protein
MMLYGFFCLYVCTVYTLQLIFVSLCFQAASKEAFDDIKRAVADGSMTRDEVLAFEKQTGMELETLVNMMKNMPKGASKELGTEDMMETFQKLLKIKKSG